MKTYIGVDLGGTNVRVANISETGEIISEFKSPAYAEKGPDFAVDNIINLIKKVENLDSVVGIGIGLPGPVDTVNGTMVLSTNLPGFKGYPIAKRITDAVNIPTFLDNDANVAGLAEALLGAGKGKDIVYYLTHSTGIGGALIVNGKLVSGKHGHAGEVGNIIIDRSIPKYEHNNLNAGALENEVSGPAIARKASKVLGKEITDAYDVFKLMQEGNEEAKKIIENMSYDFAQLLSSIAHVVDPDCFVIGGGVSKSRALYFDLLKKNYDDMVHVEMRKTEILPAELAEPGIVGAAMLPKSFGL